MNRVFIIAEAGVNHNGKLELAYKLVDVAVEAGADAVKFQTFKPEKVVSKFATKAEYQKETTGSADLQEVKESLNVLISCGTDKKVITVLHCNTQYPTPFDDVNLKAMLTIRDELSVKVGYSDHTPGIEVPVAAVALGAEVIEKHFTLDKNMEGPDHRASLEPDELKTMASAIRNIEKAMGNGIKRPSPSELKNKPIARKSIVAAKDIRKGEPFSEENLTVKRPGTGISPMRWDEIIGQKAERTYKADELISS